MQPRRKLSNFIFNAHLKNPDAATIRTSRASAASVMNRSRAGRRCRRKPERTAARGSSMDGIRRSSCPMLSAPEAGPHEREVSRIFLRRDDGWRVTVTAIRRRPPEAGAAVQRHARWLRRGGFGFWRRRSDLQFEIGRPLRWCVLFCHDGVLVIVCLQRLL